MKHWTRHLTVIVLLCSHFFIANAFASTILGTGTAALLGGDLSDPANTLDNTVSTTTASAIPTLWISASATTEPGFSPSEGSERAFDIFDNTVGGGTAKWCCSPAPQSLAIELYDQYVLTHFTIASGNDVPSRDPDIWSIDGSNDGINWTPVYSYNNDGVSPFTARLQVIRYDGNGVDFPTPAAYRWYRYNASSTVTNGGFHQINEVELFGDNYTIGGNVSGLAGSGLVLQNNGADDLSIAADGGFTFATPQADGSTYSVAVLSQPTGLSQTCTVTGGTGTVAGADVGNVSVNCVTNTYTVGGNVVGLEGSGLVLQNNGADDLSIAADGGFTFATPQADGSPYSVTILSQPTGLSQTCTVTNETGTLAGTDVGNVSVNCVTNTYTVGGNVVGLEGIGLVLQNNGADDLSIAADGSFTFATPQADGSTYSVTVLSQPTGLSQTCTVTNGTGTLAGADIGNLRVDCVTNTYTIGGNVSGLAGSGLVLQNNGADDLSIAADGGFTFATPQADGSTYSVTLLSQPTGLNQTCTVTGSAGTLAGADVGNVSVSCVTNTYTVGGNVVGLKGSGLVLQNNGADDLSIAADGSFTFATPQADGSPYSVTILSQPTGLSQTCTVTNETGTLAGTDVGNVSVNCVTNTYTVGGNVVGLEGIGLVLQNNGADDLSIAADGSFTFATSQVDGSAYSVTISSLPNTPYQYCTVTNGSGILSGVNVTSVIVDCETLVPVPALSAWGLGAFIAGLLGIVGFRCRRIWPESI